MQKKQRNKPSQKKKRGYKQADRRFEQALGFSKTRQLLKNIGRTSEMQFLKAPAGPHPGATYSVREIASTLNTSTGLSNVGGASVPAQLIQNGATVVYFAAGFRLDDLSNAAAYATLFDQYRIDRVRMHFRSRNPSAFVANTASPNGSVPIGYIVVDRDDASAPSSISSLMQYDNCIALNGSDSAYVDLVPTVTSAVFASGAFSGYSTRDSDSVWLDVANADVVTYGIKGAVGTLTATTTSAWTWDIVPEYIVSFRKSR